MSLSNGSTAVTRITDHALQLAATDLEYEVTRVKSPVLGRDLNPMGRGDGTYYANGGNFAPSGSVALRGAMPRSVGERAFGFGNDVNNQCGAGGGMSPGLGEDWWQKPPEYRPWDERSGPWPWSGYKRIKRYPNQLDEPLEYWAIIEQQCVGEGTGTCHKEGISWFCCVDKCKREPAFLFASEVWEGLCKDPVTGRHECGVYVADLPRTRREAIERDDFWGVVVAFGCEGPRNTPFIQCLCGAGEDRTWEAIVGTDFAYCLAMNMWGRSVLNGRCGGIAKAHDQDSEEEQRDPFCTQLCTDLALEGGPCRELIWSHPIEVGKCIGLCAARCTALKGTREPHEVVQDRETMDAIENALWNCCYKIVRWPR